MTTPVTRLPNDGTRFPLGRGPAIAGQDAYWISDGKLLRRRIAPGEAVPLEVLATDARTGTRVSVVEGGSDEGARPTAVGYITRPKKEDGPLRAKLWVDGGKSLALTPEGSSTNGITLVASKTGLIALAVQARMAMTPLHARRIRFEGRNAIAGDDLVVWVGGGVHPLTELTVLASGEKNLWGFIPHERSITEFGVAQLDIGLTPDMDTPTQWILYPNGIDPAPIATGHVCGEPAVVYAAPEMAAPNAPQELILRTVTDPPRSATIANGKAFFSVSMASLDSGALVAYVADWATWAVTVRCRNTK
jgi:hypothetical protein